MKKTLLFATILAALSGIAQEDPIFHWAKSSGGIGFDSAYDVAPDASGNVYTCGSFNGTIDFNPGSGMASFTQLGSATDGFLQKLDSQGNFVWAKVIGGNQGNGIFKVGFAANGDVVIAGSFNGTIDCDPNAGTFNFTSIPMANPANSSQDVFIVRLTSDGNFVWAKRIGGNNHEQVESLKLDSEGNLFVGGWFQGTCDFDPGDANYPMTATGSRDSYILKLNPAGNFIWAKRFGGTSETRLTSLDIDASGAIFAGGNFFQAIDVDPGAAQVMLQPSPPDNFGQYSQDAFLLKLDSAGNYEWAGKLGGNMADSVQGVSVYGDFVYVAGYFSGTADMDPGAGQNLLSVTSGAALYLCKFVVSGDLFWAKQTASTFSPEVRGLKAMANGDVAMTGVFGSSFAFAPNWILETSGGSDMFVSRFDEDGNLLWANAFGGSGDDDSQALEVTSNGIWHIAGSYKSTADLDPFAPVSTLSSSGSDDIFTLRLAPEALSAPDIAISDAWSIYPNPSNGVANLRFDEALVGSKVSVYTVLGQLVSQQEISQSEIQIGLKPGNYIVKVQHGKSAGARKLIVL